jgi:hypothetical protein
MSYPPPPPGYHGGYAGVPRPQHPQATTSLVLGILGVVLCQVLGPFAWAMGSKAVREIDASQGALDGRGLAVAGKVLGIVATAILALALLAIAFFVVMAVVVGTSVDTPADCYNPETGIYETC